MTLRIANAFHSTTLTDPELVRLMHDNSFIVWGGDIRDRDAWSGKHRLSKISLALLMP